MADIYERDPETEAFIDTLENNHIYRDMRDQYDKITIKDDEYTDEHDKIVAEYASRKYGISTVDAGQLYSNFEWEITKFHKRRMNGDN